MKTPNEATKAEADPLAEMTARAEKAEAALAAAKGQITSLTMDLATSQATASALAFTAALHQMATGQPVHAAPARSFLNPAP